MFSESASTLISLPGGLIEVVHSSSVALDGAAEAIVLHEPDATPNTLSRIEVFRTGAERRTVLLLWERQSVARGIALLVNQATLFIGAETFAAAVDLQAKRVVDPHTVHNFWSFQQAGEFVIELGDLRCFLRAGTGELLGEAAVDPPYEIHETAEGIRFESSVMGTHWLRFPEGR